MIGWILIVWVGADFDIWGGYEHQVNCERSRAFLAARYDKKLEPFRATCQAVMAVQLQPEVSKH